MDVALRCGFPHFGRFSIAYRRRYGETPSQTLKRQETFTASLGAVPQLFVPARDRPAVALGPIEAAAIGVLAWRRACELDVQVQPPPFAVGNRMLPDPAVVGRRYRELEDPFTLLLAILRLGCRLHALSDAATTLELQPLG